MTTVEILKAAKERIGTPESHTRGAYARDANGAEAAPTETRACRWCVYGAIWSLGLNNTQESAACDTLRKASKRYFDSTPIRVNDSREHPDVMALFDRAIALAEEAS
jgi:hypothetical protein